MAAVLVTGGAKGIGHACVMRLAAAGHRVFAGVRNAADGERLRAEGGSNVAPVQLEVTSADDIARTAEIVSREAGAAGLHGIVNNAGIVVAAPLEFVPIDEFRRQLEVNVVGVLAVTQAMLPLLRRTKGRIVNISSIAGRSALPMTGPYSASKFALEAMSDSLRIELLEFGIDVALIEPGVIATPIWQTSLAVADRNIARAPQMLEYYGKMIEAVKRRVAGADTGGLPPDRVARAVEHALFARKPRTRYLIGRDARARIMIQRLLPDRWRDRMIAAALRRM